VNQAKVVIRDHMAQITARHPAGVCSGIMDGDTAVQLVALPAGTALLPDGSRKQGRRPRPFLAAASCLSANGALRTGLSESLDLKDANPDGARQRMARLAHRLAPCSEACRKHAPVPPRSCRLRVVSQPCRQRTGMNADCLDLCSQPDGMRMRLDLGASRSPSWQPEECTVGA
jgi:hypothetical protein